MSKKQKVVNVEDLKKILTDHHNNDCWSQTKSWFDTFGQNVLVRTRFLKNIMYLPEIPTSGLYEGKQIDFSVLQGDIIETATALTKNPLFEYDPSKNSYYAIIPSSCSIQKNKYKFVTLARLWPIDSLEGPLKTAYQESVLLKNNKLFYFPPIDKINDGPFGFLAVFEEISYIENEYLQSVKRIATLSEMGWHLFNAFIANHFTRTSGDDFLIRKSSTPSTWSYNDE